VIRDVAVTMSRREWDEVEFQFQRLRAEVERRWVACSERVPTERGEYLACFRTTQDGQARVAIDWWYQGWTLETPSGGGDRPLAYKYTVTHWMPLPSPPK
jgi:Protein of unknown function (DUF551)